MKARGTNTKRSSRTNDDPKASPVIVALLIWGFEGERKTRRSFGELPESPDSARFDENAECTGPKGWPRTSNTVSVNGSEYVKKPNTPKTTVPKHGLKTMLSGPPSSKTTF
jgi:hypothetical protein